MYAWREMTKERRDLVLKERKLLKLPWHGPPHFKCDLPRTRLFTSACFEHRHILATTERLAEFETELLETLAAAEFAIMAWCVLTNHYHVLIPRCDQRKVAKVLGSLHGRTSFRWNREDGARGRQVWYRSTDRFMRSDAHLFATVNYIHNNPVHHGYVTKWQDWPFSSVHRYLTEIGRAEMTKMWREYPVLNYGAGWDEFIAPGL